MMTSVTDTTEIIESLDRLKADIQRDRLEVINILNCGGRSIQEIAAAARRLNAANKRNRRELARLIPQKAACRLAGEVAA